MNQFDIVISTMVRRCHRSMTAGLLLLMVACGGGGGSTPIVDPPGPSIAISLHATPQTARAGDSITLTWTTDNADSCVALYGWSGSKSLSGSEVIGPITDESESIAFGLTCSRGETFSATSSIGVTIRKDPPLPNGLSYERSTNAVNDLAWEPHSQRLYLAIGSPAAVHPNTVMAFDPVTGAIIKAVHAGSEPETLALSEDGQFLYVGFSGTDIVRRFRLPDLTLEATIPIDPDVRSADDSQEPYFCRQLAVAPSTPYTFAAARTNPQVFGAKAGAIVFDDQTPKPSAFRLGYYELALAWGNTPDVLFGLDYSQYEYGFDQFAVTSAGVSQTGTILGISGAIPDSFQKEGGLLFNNGGTIFDPNTRTIVGTIPASGVMAPDVENRKAFFTSTDGYGGLTLRSYDLDTRALLAESTISSQLGAQIIGSPKRLVRWGENGLALNTAAGQLVILWGPFVAPNQDEAPRPVAIIPGTTPTENADPSMITLQKQVVSVGGIDITWDALRSLLYASVPGNLTSAIVAIDPLTRVVENRFTTTLAGPIDVSKDGHYLYVGGDHAFQRFSLTDSSDAVNVPVSWGTPTSLTVAPDAPETVALGFYSSSSMIFDGASSRGPPFHGDYPFWGSRSTEIFALLHSSTAFGLYSYDVTASGVAETDYVLRKFSYMVPFPWGMTAQYVNGLIVGETGTVYRPSDRAIIGTLPFVLKGRAIGPFIIDGEKRRVFAALGADLYMFDLDTFVTLAHGSWSNTGAYPLELVRTGPESFAVLSSDDEIVFVSSLAFSQ